MMINRDYGKTMGNLVKRITVILVNNEKNMSKNQPLFLKRFSIKILLLFMKLNQF